MTNIELDASCKNQISQGDIYKNIEFIEYAIEVEGQIEVSKITFPFIIVLTQECDLTLDYIYRNEERKDNDKLILSVIVAPLYNAEHVFKGDHLTRLGLIMGTIDKNSTRGGIIKNNKNPRYHYIEFPKEKKLPELIIDFKHYFTVNCDYLIQQKYNNWVTRIKELYREDISQRFAFYLSRIGLPDLREKNTTKEKIR